MSDDVVFFDERTDPEIAGEPLVPKVVLGLDHRIGLIAQSARLIERRDHPRQTLGAQRQAHEATPDDALYGMVFAHVSQPSARTAVLMHLQQQVARRREAAVEHQRAIDSLDRARADFLAADALVLEAVDTMRVWDA